MRAHLPDQHVENVPLVHVDSDQGLKLGPVNLGEVLHSLPDQGVEHVQELVVGVAHDLLVHPAILKSQ